MNPWKNVDKRNPEFLAYGVIERNNLTVKKVDKKQICSWSDYFPIYLVFLRVYFSLRLSTFFTNWYLVYLFHSQNISYCYDIGRNLSINFFHSCLFLLPTGSLSTFSTVRMLSSVTEFAGILFRLCLLFTACRLAA